MNGNVQSSGDLLRSFHQSSSSLSKSQVKTKELFRGNMDAVLEILECQGKETSLVGHATVFLLWYHHKGCKLHIQLLVHLINTTLVCNGTVVVPNVGSVALGEPCSVVVLDNCHIHYLQAVCEMIRAKGGILVFLLPYSPDLNPIEECFGVGKAWLLRHADLCERYPQRCFEMALDSISAEICASLTQDCGYV